MLLHTRTTGYVVVMATPRSVRLDDSVLERVMSFVLSHPGLSASSAMSLLLDEALRMHEHPGIFFQDGPAGRRAKVIGGPDVWEIVRAAQATAKDKKFSSVHDLIHELALAYGPDERQIQIALTYYSHFPDEVDARIAEDERATDELMRAQEAMRTMLGA